MEKLENNLQNKFEDEEDYELGHLDKLVGVFTEPATTFNGISQFPAKASDWLLPLLLLIIIAAFSNFMMMSNPIIKQQIIEKQIEAMGKNPQVTEEQIEKFRDAYNNNPTMLVVFSAVNIVIFTFIYFFVVASVFFFLSKIIFKGDGKYSHGLVAIGLPYYISSIGVIIMVISALLMDKIMTGTSAADFMGYDKSTTLGFVLSKLDIFSIWYYTILGIGLAKIHKSEETGKYLLFVFSLWIGFSLIIFLISQKIEFFKNFLV